MVDTSFRMHEPGRVARGRVPRRRSALHAVLYASLLSFVAALALEGWQFYTTSVGARVDHPDFRSLAPGGYMGQGYGVIGTLLILTNLLYLVRRRVARLRLGALTTWLDVHVFTGLLGGVFALFHSAFQARSGAALTTLGSLLVVIATGLVGRYLFALSPPPDYRRLERVLAQLDTIGPGMGSMIEQRVGMVARTERPARRSLLAVLVRLPRWWRESRQRRAVIAQTVAHFARSFGPEVALLGKPIAEVARIHAAAVRADAAAALLDSWRALHRFAALLMVLLVIVHILVAWYYGFV